jgi:hypothetical protein
MLNPNRSSGFFQDVEPHTIVRGILFRPDRAIYIFYNPINLYRLFIPDVNFEMTPLKRFRKLKIGFLILNNTGLNSRIEKMIAYQTSMVYRVIEKCIEFIDFISNYNLPGN